MSSMLMAKTLSPLLTPAETWGTSGSTAATWASPRSTVDAVRLKPQLLAASSGSTRKATQRGLLACQALWCPLPMGMTLSRAGILRFPMKCMHAWALKSFTSWPLTLIKASPEAKPACKPMDESAVCSYRLREGSLPLSRLCSRRSGSRAG